MALDELRPSSSSRFCHRRHKCGRFRDPAWPRIRGSRRLDFRSSIAGVLWTYGRTVPRGSALGAVRHSPDLSCGFPCRFVACSIRVETRVLPVFCFTRCQARANLRHFCGKPLRPSLEHQAVVMGATTVDGLCQVSRPCGAELLPNDLDRAPHGALGGVAIP